MLFQTKRIMTNKIGLIIYTFLVFSLNSFHMFAQNKIVKDYYYEHKGFKYKSILELKLDDSFIKRYNEIKCFSNETDTLKIYFIDSKLTDILNIKDSLLKTLCINSICNFNVNSKFKLADKQYNYFGIEDGYNNFGYFQYAIIDGKGYSYLLIVIVNQNISEKTKSLIDEMFGYLIL
jgi:hypothetical protein